MALFLSEEQEVRYTAIIDSILATADLTTVTRKKIRAGLEMALGGQDLSQHKDAIKKLIEERFDRLANADEPAPKAEPSTEPEANGHGHEDVKDENVDVKDEDADGYSEVEDATPARKKQKRSESAEDADARLAAQLQAQENSMARARTTRGGGGASTKKRKAPRKKSTKKVRGADDSDVEGEEPTKKRATGGFQKPFVLSYPLAQLVGEPQLSRPQVVKKLWEHIKANELQDPSDKRQIICDEMMHSVFKQAKVDMFQMNKMIGSHLYPVEEEQQQ